MLELLKLQEELVFNENNQLQNTEQFIIPIRWSLGVWM